MVLRPTFATVALPPFFGAAATFLPAFFEGACGIQMSSMCWSTRQYAPLGSRVVVVESRIMRLHCRLRRATRSSLRRIQSPPAYIRAVLSAGKFFLTITLSSQITGCRSFDAGLCQSRAGIYLRTS